MDKGLFNTILQCSESSGRIPKYTAGTSGRIFVIWPQQIDNIMLIGIKLQLYICHQTDFFGISVTFRKLKSGGKYTTATLCQ